mgnify:CR=1 FL=1
MTCKYINLLCCASISIAGVPSLKANKLVTGQINSFRTGDLPHLSDIVGGLVNRQVDGIIYIAAHLQRVTGLIENISVPIVYTYCYTNNKDDISIYYDDELEAYEATKHLIMNNHHKIAIITGPLGSIIGNWNRGVYLLRSYCHYQIPRQPYFQNE